MFSLIRNWHAILCCTLKLWKQQSNIKVNKNWLRRRLKNRIFPSVFCWHLTRVEWNYHSGRVWNLSTASFSFSSTKKVEKVTSIKRGGRNENFNWINTFWRIWQWHTKRGDTQVPQTSRTVKNWFAVFKTKVNWFVIQVW